MVLNELGGELQQLIVITVVEMQAAQCNGAPSTPIGDQSAGADSQKANL